MLDIKKIAAMPECGNARAIRAKIRSYPFYVLYGLGFATVFWFKNYVSHFGKPMFIVDRAKGGRVFEGIPVVSSLDDIPGRDYCVLISAPSYISEITDICSGYVDNEAIIPYAGELSMTDADYPRFLLDNEAAIANFYEKLADDESRHILENWIKGRVTKNVNIFASICSPNNYMSGVFYTETLQRFLGYERIFPNNDDRTVPNDAYFTTGLFPISRTDVFYDIGAAYGDTVAGFFKYGNANGYVVAVEMEPAVAAALAKFCKMHGYDAEVKNCGAGDAEYAVEVERGGMADINLDTVGKVLGGGTVYLSV